MEGPDTPALDVTPPLDYSDELNISTESWRSEGQEAGARGAHRPSPFTLRSQCGHHDDCPLGEGILFRSRISPSPAKQRVRSRRRRRSDQSHLYTTTSSASTTVLDVSALDVSSLDASSQDLDHSHHQRAHIHGHNHVDPIHDARRVAGAGSDAPQPLQPGQMVHHRSRTPSTKETGKAAEQITQSSVTHNQTELNTSSSEGEVGGGVGDLAKNVLAFFTPTKDKSLPAIIESSESGFEDGLLTGKSVAVSTPATEQFVGARDFFAQRTTRESLASDYLSYSDTPSRLRESTRRLSVRKPHNHYIAYSSDEELDDWKQQPKTDYTYSTSLTYRERVTPDRKIWSPNMSRRGLRGAGVGYAHSPDFSSSDLPSDSGQLNLRTRTILRPMDAFSDTSDGEEAGREEEMRSWSRRLRSSRSRSASVPKVNGATITTTVTTTSMTSKRMLSGGLDGESDVDDGTQTHLPRRATPLASRSGTPLPRGSTPAPSSLDTAKGGYTLAKGAIAEDVEEEQEEAGGVVSVWTRRTWRTITRITTIITTTIVMAAARTLASNKTAAVTANADNTMEKSSSTSSSAVFFVHRTRRRVAEAWTATQDRLKKDPILLWIPLLFLFLLLAVAAYWWLLRSEGSSAEPPTHTAYLLTSSLTNAVSSLPANAWHGTVAGASWLGETSLAGLAWVWGSLVGLMGWMWGWVVWVGTAVGSWVLAGLTFLLNCLYLVWDWCEYLFVAALSLLSSLGSVLSAYLLPLPASNDTDTDTETQAAWSLGTWVDSAAWVGWAGRAWGAVVNAGTSLQTGVWEAWLWLVLTLAQALNAVSAAFLWLVTGVWGAVVWVATTLWELLVALVALGSTGATTLATTVVQVSNSVAETAILVMVPLFSASRVVKEAPEGKMVPPTAPPVPAAVPSVASVEEVVQRVLDSPQLKLFISSASHDSSKGQLTLDQVSSLVKSVVEGEVGALRTETQTWRVELEAQHSTQAHTSTSNIAALQQQQKHLLHQLDELGAGLARLEDSVEGGQKEREAARAQYQEQLEALRQEMQQLSHTLHSLQDNQTVLAGVVGRCCQNASLTVEDVERHVTRLLARVLGTPDDPAAPQPSPDALAAWLKTYFVAKEELEGRLSSLTASLQPEEGSEGAAAAATQAAVAQSTQVIMDTVVERLQGEVTRVAQQQVGQQVQVQVEAAAAVLATQLTEQLDRQLASSKKQLQDGVGATVELAVGEQLGATLSASVAEAVSDAVAQALPGAVTAALPDHVQAAVSGTLPAAVDVAVAQAISQAVGAAVAPAVEVAVTGAVEAAVIKAVGTAVPGAVTQQLPALVTAAVKETIAVQVQEAVAVAVPEVVASQLSANLATAVNNSVAAALNSDTHTAQVVGVAGGRLVDEGGFSATVNLSHGGGVAGLNASAVERIVKEALRTYDADRTGMVDHALESAGGNIISTRCTESYQVHQAELSILGFTIYRYSTNNPRTIIQPDRMPGQCWAFKGSQGYIVIRLAAFVRPTAFTLEHIPRSLSPTGEIDSAPREFEVWGLQTENDEGILLGRYEYLKTGEPLQSFPVVGDNLDYFPLVELKILNNHGNLHYTCLYRFRVHGVRKI